MILMRMKMGHTGVSDIESKESGKPSNIPKKKKNPVYAVLLEVACTLSNILKVQQF